MKKSLILAAMLSVGYAAAQYDGRVGINTDIPTATLNVKSITGSAASGKNLELMDSNGISRVTVLNNGLVGVGTDAPKLPLHIYNSNAHKLRFQHDGVSDMWTDFGKRDNGLFIITNWANGKWNPAISLTNEGNVSIGGERADERLDVHGKVKVRSLFNELGTDTDKIVVVDNTGVLKSVDRSSISGTAGLTSEVDGIIGNEVTDATVNGGLVRSGSGTASSPYTLGLPAGTAVGQTMVWNGTAWEVKAPEVGGTLQALTGEVEVVDDINVDSWTANGKNYFALIQTGTGTIDLPAPASYKGKIIAVNNQSGTTLNFGTNNPKNYSTVESGGGFLLISNGTRWYVIGGGI